MLGHKHKWSYMFSNGDNSVQWFFCSECLAQACAELDVDTSKIRPLRIFEVQKPVKNGGRRK